MSRQIVSRSDAWAGVSSSHLSAAKVDEANHAKELLVGAQKDRIFLQAPYETGEKSPKDYLIDTLDRFVEFLDSAIELANRQPTVVCLETKGNTNFWVKARKRLDGQNYYKNDESSGVTVILFNILKKDSENMVAFVDVKTIIENELDGIPNLPDTFRDLLRHEQTLLTGENINKHLNI